MTSNFAKVGTIIYDYKDLAKKYRDGIFFNVAIIKRHKDGHKSGNSMNRAVKSYFIANVEELEKYADEIQTICEAFQARAYFDPQPRSWEDMALETTKDIATRLWSKDYNMFHRIPLRAATTCKRLQRFWILDIDDNESYDEVWEYLSSKGYLNVYYKIPTHKGVHIILPPFDNREFSTLFPDVEVKKNNMTLLYYPNSLEDK